MYFWVALYSLNLQEINVFLLKKNSRYAAGIPYLLAATPLAHDKKTKEPNYHIMELSQEKKYEVKRNRVKILQSKDRPMERQELQEE